MSGTAEPILYVNFCVDICLKIIYTINSILIHSGGIYLIADMQKVTLLDYPEKVACTVFLTGCNLRCPYCHNPGLVLSQQTKNEFSETELLDFLASRQGKLDGVCITGGEPTLHSCLPNLIRNIRKLGFAVKLDSNGTAPEMLRLLLQEKLLDYVAMDIKNSPTRYVETCGVDVIGKVMESTALLLNGKTNYEFRTTVCHPFHTPKEMKEIGCWLRGAEKYYIQPFVDSGNLLGDGVSALTEAELNALLEAVLPYIPATKIRGR